MIEIIFMIFVLKGECFEGDFLTKTNSFFYIDTMNSVFRTYIINTCDV